MTVLTERPLTDFSGSVNSDKLDHEISEASVFTAATYHGHQIGIDATGAADATKIVFITDIAPTTQENTDLNTVISAHPNSGVDNPAPPSRLKVTQIEVTIASEASYDFVHDEDPGLLNKTIGTNDKPQRFIKVEKRKTPLGANLASGLTPYDPNNYSTFDANINDGNLINFWYNNSSTGPAGKWIGLDAGAGNTVTATHAKWYDYTNATFQPTQYRIEGSNDGSAWTTIVDISTPPHLPANTTDGHLVDLGGTHTYRYYRWYCVTGENTNYVIISEFELYNVTDPDLWRQEDGFEIMSLNKNTTRITNNNSESMDVLLTAIIP